MTSESPPKSTVVEAAIPARSKTPTPKHVFEGQGHVIRRGRISSIVFLHDNVHIVSGWRDGTMRKWNCDTGLVVGDPWKGEGGVVHALALSPDGKTIGCGREDGSVQLWNTVGDKMERVWKGHSYWVLSLSWSPSGSHLASGSDDTTILIRKAESGEVDVGPIKTEQSWVRSLAYSPVGDRIASGGENKTICIWDSKTGELVVGPIKDLGNTVTSLVWSSDGTKLYSSSDYFARVFESVTGTELYRFEHAHSYLCSVALSPIGNVLACVGYRGGAQLWDTETHQQLGESFGQENKLQYVSFSQDGRYFACGSDDHEITLWLVNEIAPELAGASTTIEDAPPEETQPESPSLSFLDLDAKNPRAQSGNHREEGIDNQYNNFFRSSKTSLSLAPSESVSRPFYRRFWTFVIPARHRPREKKTLPSKERHQHSLLRRRARSKPPTRVSATTDYSEGKVQEVDETHESRNDVDCPANSPPDAHKKNGKGKQREDYLADAHTPAPDDSSPPAEEREDQYDFQTSAPSGPSRHHASGNESIVMQQRHKRSSFAQDSGPRPVTIYAGRQKMLRYTSRRAFRANDRSADKKTDAQTGQSSSAAAQASSTQPHSTTLNQQQQQAQAATQPASAQRKEYDFGCWGNFRIHLALCCIPRGTDIVAVPSAA